MVTGLGCNLTYLFMVCCAQVAASVECQPFWTDGNTPVAIDLSYKPPCYDLMVGSRILFVVTGSSSSYWPGGLLVVIGSEPSGLLRAMDYNDLTLDWAGSRSTNAGPQARVWQVEGWFGSRLAHGFQFMGSDKAEPGRWFYIEYIATNEGLCQVEFYDFSISYTQPLCTYLIRHCKTRDLDANGRVGLEDLARLALYWRQPVGPQTRVDLDGDGLVGPVDLWLFLERWLDRSF